MTLEDAYFLGALERGSEVSVLKSAADPHNRLSTLVLRRCEEDGRAFITKVYPWQDREYANNEYSKASQLVHESSAVQTPEPVGRAECFGKYVRNDYRDIDGLPLSIRRGALGYDDLALRTILTIISSFGGSRMLPLSGPMLNVSGPQGMHFWSGTGEGFPDVRSNDLLREFVSNRTRCGPLVDGVNIELTAWMDVFWPQAADTADKIRDVIHADLIADNIICRASSEAVVDVGLAMHATLFHEWGGVVSHLGPCVAHDVLKAASTYCECRGLALSQSEILVAIAAFAIHRSVRRLAYLAFVSTVPASDVSFIASQVRHQSATVKWALSSASA